MAVPSGEYSIFALNEFERVNAKMIIDSLNLELLADGWKQNLSLRNPRINTYVVLDSELLIAYSRFYPSADPDDNPDRVATIGSMYVDPEFQRRGIGRVD